MLTGRLTQSRDELYEVLHQVRNVDVVPALSELIELWWSAPTATAAEQLTAFVESNRRDGEPH